MKQVKATFFLPLRDNDGRDLSREIGDVEDECFLEFGAWTLSGYFKGVWRMDSGERKFDTSAAYVVLLPEEQVADLEEILRRFKARTIQEAIYLEIEHNVDFRLI
jgi:hypothetical protein